MGSFAGPCGASYQDTEKLITKIVWNFRRRYGADDVEEMMSIARIAFMEAFNKYNTNNEKGANFTTYLQFVVWKALLSWKRQIAKNHARMRFVSLNSLNSTTDDRDGKIDDSLEAPEDSDSRIKQLLCSVSADARYVIRLVFDTPSDISVPLQLNLRRVTPKSMFRAIIKFLEDCGWENPRIASAVREVKEAIAV